MTIIRSLLLIAAIVVTAGAVPWPVPPLDSHPPLGNNWGNIQDYGGGPYFHNGIDIITPGISGAPVYAVRHGWVKGWGTISAEYHYRLAICDTSPEFTGRARGWLYAHIDPERPHKGLGDEVAEGELIGYLVPWPVTGFDHLHFARISDTGAYWMRFPDVTWWFIENPLLSLRPNTDLVSPVFQNARTGQRFAFCRDNSSSYLSPNALNGAVDIICRCYDRTGYTTHDTIWDKLAPFQIDYSIRSSGGATVVPWTASVQFSGRLASTSDTMLTRVVYKRDNTCRSLGDYDRREYYFIVTNTDGDSLIELTDAAGCWQTNAYPDGDYWVLVRASDISGNTTVDSMLVTTANGVAVSEATGPLLVRPLRLTSVLRSGQLRVSFSLACPTDCRILIVDAAGRVVWETADQRFEAGQQKLAVRVPSSGVYLFQLLLGNGERYSRKFIVVR